MYAPRHVDNVEGAGQAPPAAEGRLVRDAIEGDLAAFDRLVERLEPDLRPYLRAALRTRPEIEVEDVLQEVRIYLYQRLRRYDPRYPAIAFALGLARNVIKRHLYRRSDLLAVSSASVAAGPEALDLCPSDLERLPPRLRPVAGEGRFADPSGPTGPSDRFLKMFEVFLRYGGYPHQQLAFGWSVLLSGRSGDRKASSPTGSPPRKKVPLTGDPSMTVRDLGHRDLAGACDEMLRELQKDLDLEESYLARVRDPLDRRLRMTGRELFDRDRTSSLQFSGMADEIVGATVLARYFGQDQRKSIADWTHAVKVRIRRNFLLPEERRRSFLPFAAIPRDSDSG